MAADISPMPKNISFALSPGAAQINLSTLTMSPSDRRDSRGMMDSTPESMAHAGIQNRRGLTLMQYEQRLKAVEQDLSSERQERERREATLLLEHEKQV